MVFYPDSTFPNRKAKCGVRKLREEELGRGCGDEIGFSTGSHDRLVTRLMWRRRKGLIDSRHTGDWG